jgi:hypothetical protein
MKSPYNRSNMGGVREEPSNPGGIRELSKATT